MQDTQEFSDLRERVRSGTRLRQAANQFLAQLSLDGDFDHEAEEGSSCPVCAAMFVLEQAIGGDFSLMPETEGP